MSRAERSVERYLTALNRRVLGYVPARPVLVGAAVTAALMPILFFIPDAINFEEFRRVVYDRTDFYFLDNPFLPFPYLAGLAGGYTAGYLSRDVWWTFGNGIKAAILGVAIYYVGSSTLTAIQILLMGELTGTILMVVYMQPLLFVVIPLALLYTFQSLLSAPLGYAISNVVDARYSLEASDDAADAQTRVVFRRRLTAVAGLVGLLVLGWAIGFYTYGAYG